MYSPLHNGNMGCFLIPKCIYLNFDFRLVLLDFPSPPPEFREVVLEGGEKLQADIIGVSDKIPRDGKESEDRWEESVRVLTPHFHSWSTSWFLSCAIMKWQEVLELLLAIISYSSSSREHQRRSDAKEMRRMHRKSENMMFTLYLANSTLNCKALKLVYDWVTWLLA